MDEQDYKRQEINEYLLGALSPAETERFDELSFTDDEFAGEIAVAENELIDAYVRGELGGASSEKFQSYYLASPLRRERVNFAKTFQIYEKHNAGKKVENPIPVRAQPGKASGGFFSSLNFFKNENSRRMSFAFAALLLMIAGGFLFLKNQSNQSNKETETAKQNAPSNIQPEQPPRIEEKQSANQNKEIAAGNSANEIAAPLPENTPAQKKSNKQPVRMSEPIKTITPPHIVASFILAPSLRGGEQVKSLLIPAQTTKVKMRLELETDDFTAYRVALTDETGSVKLWQSGKVKATTNGEDKSLNIHFPAGLLKSKIYSLVVSGVDFAGQTEIISNYSFRSVIK